MAIASNSYFSHFWVKVIKESSFSVVNVVHKKIPNKFFSIDPLEPFRVKSDSLMRFVRGYLGDEIRRCKIVKESWAINIAP